MAAPTTNDGVTTARRARVQDLVADPEDEVGWECNEEEQVLPEMFEITRNMQQAEPAPVNGQLRIGVDLGGVLMAKIPGRMLAAIRAGGDLVRHGGLAR